MCRLVLLNQSQRLLGVKVLHDQRGAAQAQNHQVVVQRRSVIERCRRQVNRLDPETKKRAHAT